MLKRVLIILVLCAIGITGYYVWVTDRAETVIYNCGVLGTYRLVIPWLGDPAFYQVVDGQLEKQPVEVTQETIRFWLNDKDRHKNPANKGGGMVIDRKTLWTDVNQCIELDSLSIR